MPQVVTLEQIHTRLNTLYSRNEYEIVGGFKWVTKPVKIRHNLCGNTFTTTIKNCIYSTRFAVPCPHCRVNPRGIIAETKFNNLLGDQYKILDKYSNRSTPITLKCLTHNEIFVTVPHRCIQNNKIMGCKKCRSRCCHDAAIAVSQIENKFKAILGDSYQILEPYVNNRTPIRMRCLIHNTFFKAYPNKYQVSGCPDCRKVRKSVPNDNDPRKKTNKQNFLALLGEQYELHSHYNNTISHVKLFCKEHNQEFLSDPAECLRHSRIIGCPDCTNKRRTASTKYRKNHILAKTRFASIAKADKRFKIIKSYEGRFIPVKLRCLIHNKIFTITPDACEHQGGIAGCSRCKYVSGFEREVLAYTEAIAAKNKYKVEHNRVIKDDLGRFRPDIIIPELQLAIECNGVYWHSAVTGSELDDKWRHHNRRKRLEALGYRVIQLWEDDWYNRTKVIKAYLKAVIYPSSLPVWDARKLIIKSVSNSFAREFMDNHHPQGKSYGKNVNYGLFDPNIKRTVAVISFSVNSRPIQHKANTAELIRYATRGRVRGGASRLLTHFTRENTDIQTIVSFSDNDYFDGGMYPAIGFKFDGDVNPDYTTLWNEVRHHKSFTKRANLSRLAKQKIIKFNPNRMTEKSCLEYNCIRRCWNSGKKRWIYSLI